MSDVTEKWRTQRVTAAPYDAGVQHATVARAGAWAMWDADLRPMFTDIARLADLRAGTSVLDIPCGGGLAFRGLRTGQLVRYVAADISPYMLQRVRREAGRRGVHDVIHFVETDVTALQFADDSFALCLTYNGLHCLPDPRAALAELVRVLRPGGTLRGTSCVTGRGLRQNALIALSHRAGVFGNTPRTGEIEKWLTELGLETLEHSGAVEFFEARSPFVNRRIDGRPCRRPAAESTLHDELQHELRRRTGGPANRSPSTAKNHTATVPLDKKLLSLIVCSELSGQSRRPHQTQKGPI
jgi:SAM-dependent methyltransferase